MNRLIRTIALGLSVLMGCSLCACGATGGSGTENSDVAPGMWIEENVSPEHATEDILAIDVDSSDRMVCASVQSNESGAQSVDIITSSDGTTWDSEPLYSIDLSGNCIMASFYDDDSILVLTQTEDANQIWYASQTTEPTQIELVDFEVAHISNLQFIDANTFFLIGQDVTNQSIAGIFRIQDGRMVTKVGTSAALAQWKGFARSGNQLYFVSETGELSTLEANGEIKDAHADGLTDISAAFCDQQGNYYFANKDGFYRIAKGGTLQEGVVSSSGFAFSVQNQILSDLLYFNEGFFCVVKDANSDSVHLYSYTYDPDAVPPEQIELTIWSLEDSPTVRKVLSEYQQQHKEVSIKYTIAGSDDLSTEDVLKALNTELLAGSGPDIIVFDGIDVTPYIENGVLADISETVNDLSILDSIKSAFSVDGKTHIIAARYAIPSIWGTTEDLSKITDLSSFVEFVKSCPARADCNLQDNDYYQALSQEEKYAVSFLTPDEILGFLMSTSASNLISDNAIDKEQLQEMFEAIETIGTYYNMSGYRDEQEDDSIIYSDGGDTITIEGASREVINGRARVGRNQIDSPAFFGWIAKNTEDSNLVIKSAPGLCENAYTPKVMLGVNANSANKEAAMDVLKAFFDENVQNTVIGDGLPVIESSLENRIDTAVETYGTNRDMLSSFLKGVKTPVIVDEVIYDKLLPYAEAVAKGQQSAEDATKAAEKDLRLYLAERG